MKVSIQAICNIGSVRQNNEDAVSVGGIFLRDNDMSFSVDINNESCFYLLVADGMGGHDNGEVASEQTIQDVTDFLGGNAYTEDTFEDMLRQTVQETSDKLNAMALDEGQEKPMGCTLTGAIIYNGRVWLINAGDSRTYRFREGILRQLTTDQTERGMTGNPDASKLLLNCVGGGTQGRLAVEDITGKVTEGDRLLLCSDGLYDMVPDDDLESALDANCDASALLNLALNAGGHDNISIVLAELI